MNYKTKTVDGKDVKFRSDWILDLERREHFDWYYNQAKLVYSECSRDEKILEIGPGTCMLSDMLRRRYFNISTLDIDEDKPADFHADALSFNYCYSTGEAFKVILAFEIFEHIPWETFVKLVSKLSAEEGVKKIIFSLPICEKKIASLNIKLPKLKEINLELSIPKKHISCTSHFWELAASDKGSRSLLPDKRLVALTEVRKIFQDNNFNLSIRKKSRYIQYFVAEKTSENK